MVQGELKGVAHGEAFGEVLVYRHCELDHRNKHHWHLIKKRVAVGLSCIELLATEGRQLAVMKMNAEEVAFSL